MYLLKTGSAEVSVRDAKGGGAKIVGKIVPGQCFGEISLWMESKRSTTVTATDFSQFFILNARDLDEVR